MTESQSNEAPAEIHNLHDEAARLAKSSRESLDRAIFLAWQTGKLLREKREQVRRTMGRSAWPTWLSANFPGSRTTADRYMLLARTVADPAKLPELSLNQAYFRLNIPTEPKTRTLSPRVLPLPRHIYASQRLLICLREELGSGPIEPARRRLICQDLKPLHEQLLLLFAPGTAA